VHARKIVSTPISSREFNYSLASSNPTESTESIDHSATFAARVEVLARKVVNVIFNFYNLLIKSSL